MFATLLHFHVTFLKLKRNGEIVQKRFNFGTKSIEVFGDQKFQINKCIYFYSVACYAEHGSDLYTIYWQTEQKCRRLFRIMAGYPILQQTMYVSAIYVSISSILAGEYDTSAWSLPMQMSVPFDTTVISGWYLLWFIQLNESLTYAFCMITTTFYFVCCCFYINTLCDHLELSFRTIEQEISENRNDNNSNIHRRKFTYIIEEKLFNAIKLHVEILE